MLKTKLQERLVALAQIGFMQSDTIVEEGDDSIKYQILFRPNYATIIATVDTVTTTYTIPKTSHGMYTVDHDERLTILAGNDLVIALVYLLGVVNILTDAVYAAIGGKPTDLLTMIAMRVDFTENQYNACKADLAAHTGRGVKLTLREQLLDNHLVVDTDFKIGGAPVTLLIGRDGYTPVVVGNYQKPSYVALDRDTYERHLATYVVLMR